MMPRLPMGVGECEAREMFENESFLFPALVICPYLTQHCSHIVILSTNNYNNSRVTVEANCPTPARPNKPESKFVGPKNRLEIPSPVYLAVYTTMSITFYHSTSNTTGKKT